MQSPNIQKLLSLLVFVHTVLESCGARSDVELDFKYGKVSGLSNHPYIQLLAHSQPSVSGRCDGKALVRLDFNGPFKKARFKLMFGEKPKLWTVNIADSPTSYGFGQNHRYTSNCAEAQIINRQFRVYGNTQPGFRGYSMNGQTLITLKDDFVDVGTNLTIEVGDEMLRWKTQNRNRAGNRQEKFETKREPSLYMLSGQHTLYGPQEQLIFAGFNRVPLSDLWNGSGLCNVKITLLPEQEGKTLCRGMKRRCHKDAFCKIYRKKPRCHCKPGFRGNGLKCKDIDECRELTNGKCHHKCHNSAGSFFCTCRHGYQLQPNKRDCVDSRLIGTVRKKIRLRVPFGQPCRHSIVKSKVLEDLRRKLLSQEICNFPCKIHNVGLRCRSRKNSHFLQAIFEIELDKMLVLTSSNCNTSCLQCQMENRLQRFVSDLRNLADSDKLNVSVNGKDYVVDRRSVKAGRWTNACDQRNRSRRISKRVAGCRPGMYFEEAIRRCMNCSVGSYQPTKSEKFCYRCPGNTTTYHTGARDISECKATICGGRLTQMKGVIMSPNFPTSYPPGVKCTWNIRSPPGRGLLLLMPNISLPVTSNCADYLTMRESKSELSVVTFHSCESFDKPVAFISRSENLFIEFHSSGVQTAQGFRLFYATFKDMYRDLVRSIVEDGELYSIDNHTKLLQVTTVQNEKLLEVILEVMLDPQMFVNQSKYEEILRISHPTFYNFVKRKVMEYMSSDL